MASKRSAAGSAPTARKVKEIILEVDDTQGTLAEMLGYLAEHGVNLLAYSALRMHNTGVLHLIPDNAARALRLLAKTPATKIGAADIVYAVARDRVGGGAEVTRKIFAAGVNIHYSYATSAGGNRYGVVFQTANNAKAIRAINH